MSAKQNAPVIIKRKKIIAADGHHGGAWKVAYADFVTAMMAFFLLMWLLNATTEKQRKGLADYFSPTIPVNRISGGGDGSFGGDNVFSEETLAQNGVGATLRKATEANAARGSTGTSPSDDDAAADTSSFETVEEALSGMSGESMVSDEMLRHIVTRVSDEGLIVELFDLPGEPLFERGSNTPTPIMRELTKMVSRVFALVANDVAINGYSRARPVVLIRNPVWEISHARADRARTLLLEGSLPGGRVQRVSGFADRKPVARNPMDARNNRIELILLRSASS
ncbi:MAG TPA: chemotaxis protein MotB [Rhodobacteraceae bacterium]|nr:chemotaxis protein MotB [Paracoccaceae bacterium]